MNIWQRILRALNAGLVYLGLVLLDRVLFTIRYESLTIKGEIYMAELREGQQFDVTASLKTAGGRDAAYQTGSASWTSSDPSIATVTPASDNELFATVKGVNGSNNGSAVIEFRADGDPDADQTRQIVGTLAVTVTQGEAVVVDLQAGTPSDTPPAADPPENANPPAPGEG